MYLTKFTYYSFRTLIYLANNRDRLCTADELFEKLEISKHHLKIIIWKLAKTDLVISMKGRTGGIKLGVVPRDINLGEVIKITESNLRLDKYFNIDNCCEYINSNYKVKEIIQEALDEFINEFSKFTLADLL